MRLHQQTAVCKTVTVILFAVGTFLIGEFLVLYNASQSWSIPDAKAGSLLVLAIADPQIQGYTEEPPGIIGMITRWDSDRYLRQTFSLALNYIEPDVVVFLGDLLDEGCTGTDEEFLEYKERFHGIFVVPDGIPKIYLAGDNDICGEGADVLTPHTVGRFSRAFGPVNDVINIKSFQFVKLNTVSFLRFSVPAYKEEKPTYNHTLAFCHGISSHVREDSTVVLLTHVPLPNVPSNLYHKFLSVLKPKVSLAGHLHKHLQVFHQLKTPGTSFWEYSIPTCSYRMGTKQIGAGVLVIGESQKPSVSILKFPERYTYLLIYLVYICTVFAIYLLSFRLIRRKFLSVCCRIICFPLLVFQKRRARIG